MKKILSVLIVIFISSTFVFAQDITSYYKVGTVDGSIKDVSAKVYTALKAKGFTIYGSYYPQGKYSNKVIAFTRKDIYGVTLIGKDQRVMASMLKVGLIKKGGGDLYVSIPVEISAMGIFQGKSIVRNTEEVYFLCNFLIQYRTAIIFK